MIVSRPPLFRPDPKGPPEAYKTYQLLQPERTHTKPATCQQVECQRMRNGWRSVMDTSTVVGRKQANWIRLKSGRAFTYVQQGPVVTFTFAAGQRCFEKHRVPLYRDPILRVAGGDWRGNPRGTSTQVLSARSWTDNFGEHQARLSEAQQRG